MIRIEGDVIQLKVPVTDAVSFAMGWSDLGYEQPTAAMRRIIGELAVDRLEYAEEWRVAAMLKSYIDRQWRCEE